MKFETSWILNALMDNTADSFYVKDLECRLWLVSKRMAVDLGFSGPEEVHGKTDIDLFGEAFGKRTMKDDLQVMETGQPKIGIIEKRIDRFGETNWTSTTKLPLRNDDDQVIGLLGVTREINELKNSQMEYQFLAMHDPLTSLANRVLLIDQIEQAIFCARKNKSQFALLFIDLNGFKHINDTVGHDIGDIYLKKLAQVLTENVRISDTVGRMGGDEFVILLNQINHIENALAIARKISELICSEVDPDAHSISAAIGVSIFPQHGEDAESLLKAADRAMYAAKTEAIDIKLAEN